VQLFLGAFPVESRLQRSLFSGAGAEVTLHFDAAGAGASNELVRRLKVVIGNDGRLVLGSIAYPGAADRPARQHSRPSFLIDFDEPVFGPVLADARAQLGAAPSVDAIVHFVERFITNKGMARGYDIASVVAKRREGDCTEHAVLLTALARAFKLPARVVSGVVLTEVDGRQLAFGHAWAEIHRGGRWQRADAAFTQPDKLVYLPLELISDEGAGFSLSMLKASFGTLGVRRISIAEPGAANKAGP
jgi:transglutaminase-like putative cysteine protease